MSSHFTTSEVVGDTRSFKNRPINYTKNGKHSMIMDPFIALSRDPVIWMENLVLDE